MCLKSATPVVCLMALLGGTPPGPPQAMAGPEAIIEVADHGAVADGKSDAGPGIRAAIKAAMARGPGCRVRLEAGVYRVGAEAAGQPCFSIARARDLVIEGVRGRTEIRIYKDGTRIGVCEVACSAPTRVECCLLAAKKILGLNSGEPGASI